MSLQRIIALCLLVLYGVPASLGPHWHAHHHVHVAWFGDAQQCQSDSCGSAETPSSGCGCHSIGAEATHSQTGHSANRDLPQGNGQTSIDTCLASTSHAPKSTDDNAILVLNGAHVGHCVICDYYAQAKSLSHTLCLTLNEAICASCKQLTSLSASRCIALAKARGPPLSL